MISFFRRTLRSPIVQGLFALILIAFAITSVDTSSTGQLFGGGSGTIASVGRRTVTIVDATKRINTQIDAARQEKPGLDMLTFAQGGGIEGTIDVLISNIAIEEFARKLGMVVSTRQVDGAIASIPAFNGPTGKFDPATFRNVLAQRRLSEPEVREDFSRGILENMIRFPSGYGARAPASLVTPYAALVLEERAGQVAFVRSAAFTAGLPPTEAEIARFYQRNTVRYTVPETRSLKYALIDRRRFEGKIVPSDPEIAAAYKAQAATYAARETRGFDQVIVQSETAAKTIAAKASTGMSLAVAATASGAEATAMLAQSKPDFALLSSAAIADAAFAAARGTVLVPMKSALGWHVVRVADITVRPAQSLAQVRPVLVAELTKSKVDGALADFIARIEELVVDGATFDDVVKSQALTIVTVPAVTAAGIAPDTPSFKAPPELPVILRDVFQDEADADAAVATLAPGQAFAFYDLDRINAAAPRPLALIKPLVVRDYQADRAGRAARKVADQIAAQVTKGVPLAAAMARAGVKLDPPLPVGGKRREITASGGKVPPAVALLFSMAAKRAKTLEAPGNAGWFVVSLDTIKSGNPASEPALIPQMAGEFKQLLGREYAEQLVTAIRADVTVKKNDNAIKRLKGSLTGSAVP